MGKKSNRLSLLIVVSIGMVTTTKGEMPAYIMDAFHKTQAYTTTTINKLNASFNSFNKTMKDFLKCLKGTQVCSQENIQKARLNAAGIIAILTILTISPLFISKRRASARKERVEGEFTQKAVSSTTGIPGQPELRSIPAPSQPFAALNPSQDAIDKIQRTMTSLLAKPKLLSQIVLARIMDILITADTHNINLSTVTRDNGSTLKELVDVYISNYKLMDPLKQAPSVGANRLKRLGFIG